MMAVEQYLDGKDSLASLLAKFKLKGNDILQKWILLHNIDMELKDYSTKQEV